jgi:hypothetical protein
MIPPFRNVCIGVQVYETTPATSILPYIIACTKHYPEQINTALLAAPATARVYLRTADATALLPAPG